MKRFLKKHWLRVVGIMVGITAGFLYYRYVGCITGTCPITSNPNMMMISGALAGYLVFDLFSHNEEPKDSNDISREKVKDNN